MSFVLRTSRFAAAARPATASRTFMTSSVRALKETDSHNPGPEQAEKYEKHKQDQLDKQKEGKGHWKPELASDSEEAVNADRHSKNDSIEEMQKKTTEHANKTSKHGTSQDSGL